MMLGRLSLLLHLLIAFYTSLAAAKAAQEPAAATAAAATAAAAPGYRVGQPIPVSCLNRTV